MSNEQAEPEDLMGEQELDDSELQHEAFPFETSLEQQVVRAAKASAEQNGIDDLAGIYAYCTGYLAADLCSPVGIAIHAGKYFKSNQIEYLIHKLEVILRERHG